MNSTRAGIKSRTHCRRVGLPVDAEATSVFAQWAAVNDVWRINGKQKSVQALLDEAHIIHIQQLLRYQEATVLNCSSAELHCAGDDGQYEDCRQEIVLDLLRRNRTTSTAVCASLVIMLIKHLRRRTASHQCEASKPIEGHELIDHTLHSRSTQEPSASLATTSMLVE